MNVRYELAEFLALRGQDEEATAEYIDVSDELIHAGSVPEAIQALEKGLQIDASNRDLRCRLARAWMLQNDNQRAVDLLEGIRHQHPEDAELLTLLADAR
jgi:predicted Zn-dependent protease